MIIYCTTNLINGKKYIGKDKKNNPSYLGSGKLLFRAIKLYGKDNFKKEILAYAKDSLDLNELEKYYIEYYNAQNSDSFYNLASGGTGGKTTPNYDHKKVSVYELDCYGNIIKEYPSGRDAAKELNINYKHISAVINGKRKTASGRFFCRVGEEHNISETIIDKQSRITYLSLVTGIFYFNLKAIWQAEYTNKMTYEVFYSRFCYNKNKFLKLNSIEIFKNKK